MVVVRIWSVSNGPFTTTYWELEDGTVLEHTRAVCVNTLARWKKGRK